jgi:hypothetical protein
MQFRPILLHTCFDQSKNEPRPKKCKCRKRVGDLEALAFIENGIAEWILDYRNLQPCPDCGITPVSRCGDCGGTGRHGAVPCKKCAKELYLQNSCTRCGGPGMVPTRTRNLVMVVRAHKTPRVHTIEKADIERAYIDGKQEDIDRINAWGELSQEVLVGLMCDRVCDEKQDPFYGMPILRVNQ